MTFTFHDTKISLVYEERNAFIHEYYHSTTVKYSESDQSGSYQSGRRGLLLASKM